MNVLKRILLSNPITRDNCLVMRHYVFYAEL